MDLRVDGGCQEGGFSKLCEAGSIVRTQRQLHRLREVESTNKNAGYTAITVAAHLRVRARAMNTQELHFFLMQWFLSFCPTTRISSLKGVGQKLRFE